MRKKAEALHLKALEIAKNYRKLEAELLEILIQMEKSKAFKTLGYPSLFQYATLSLKLSEANSYNFITIARKSIEVPELQRQVVEGSLSVSQAKRVVPVINQTNQDSWISKAITLPQKKLEKLVAAENPKLATPERATYVAKERLSLSFGMSEMAFEKFKKLQDLISQNLKKSCTMEETLDELMGFYEKQKDPVEKAKRIISKPKTNRHVAPLNLSQGKPLIPSFTQHQVNLRDQRRCAYKDNRGMICQNSRFVEIHHLKPLSKGGTHEINNLITVCKYHLANIITKHCMGDTKGLSRNNLDISYGSFDA